MTCICVYLLEGCIDPRCAVHGINGTDPPEGLWTEDTIVTLEEYRQKYITLPSSPTE